MITFSSTLNETAAELNAVLEAAGRHQRTDHPKAFGAALANFAGVSHGCVVSSDCAALSTLIGALQLTAGDRVLVAAHLRTSFVFPLLFAGLKPRFVDCLAPDLSLDIRSVAAAASDDIRAVVLAAPWGVIQPTRGARALIRQVVHCPIILDATDCLSRALSSSGMGDDVDVMVLSLTEGQSPLSTGEGGAILSGDPELVERAAYYQRFADLEGASLGINQKISGVQAALGLHRLNRLRSAGVAPHDVAPHDGERALQPQKLGENQLATFETFTILNRPLQSMSLPFEAVLLPRAHALNACAPFTSPCPALDALAERYCAVPHHTGRGTHA